MKKDTYIRFLFWIVAILLLIPSSINGQEFTNFKADQYHPEDNYGSFNYVQLNYFKGNHAGYENLAAPFKNGYNAAELRLGWQSTGRQEWQRLHNHPVYGLGVFTSSLGESDVDSVLGAPSGIYFFYGEPIARFGKFTVMFDLGIGLSYDFNPYDAQDNPANNIIGSRVNLYFNGNALLYYRVDDNIDISAGLNFLHFSNGRTNTPQRGINLMGVNIGAKYNFNPMKNFTKHVDPDRRLAARPEFVMAPKPPLKRFGEIQLMASLGTVETEPGETKAEDGTFDSINQKRYPTSTVSAEYAFLVGRTLKLHTGLDAMYDASWENYHDGKTPGEVDFAGKFMLGYHVGFQYLIERFAFYYSLGWYLYKEAPARGNWYMRVGGRIGLTPKIDAHVALKTRNGGIADWIEWGIAYKIRVHGGK